MAKEYKDLIVGLDIGTAKVMAVVAEVCPAASCAGGLGVPSTAQARRGGQHRRHRASIQQALKEAELMADCKISASTPASPAATSAAQLQRHGGVKDKEVTPPTWRA
jgi:cell division protein FtsA